MRNGLQSRHWAIPMRNLCSSGRRIISPVPLCSPAVCAKRPRRLPVRFPVCWEEKRLPVPWRTKPIPILSAAVTLVLSISLPMFPQMHGIGNMYSLSMTMAWWAVCRRQNLRRKIHWPGHRWYRFCTAMKNHRKWMAIWCSPIRRTRAGITMQFSGQDRIRWSAASRIIPSGQRTTSPGSNWRWFCTIMPADRR